MRPRNNQVPGLRRPTEQERCRIVQAWNTGTRPGSLRKLQLFLCGFSLVMGVLRALGDEGGFDPGAGIATAVATLLLCSPFILAWNSQISKITRRAAKLNNGQFLVAAAEGERAIANRWNMFYVGFGTARFADGTVLTDLQVPYSIARKLEKERRNFPALVVAIDGEKTPIMVPDSM